MPYKENNSLLVMVYFMSRSALDPPNSNWICEYANVIKRKRVITFFRLATSFIPTEINHKTIHEYNPTDVPKKIRSTHIPAGSYGNENNRYWSTNEKKSRAIPWGTQEVGKFLKTIGYEEFVPVFKDNVSWCKYCVQFLYKTERLALLLVDCLA